MRSRHPRSVASATAPQHRLEARVSCSVHVLRTAARALNLGSHGSAVCAAAAHCSTYVPTTCVSRASRRRRPSRRPPVLHAAFRSTAGVLDSMTHVSSHRRRHRSHLSHTTADRRSRGWARPGMRHAQIQMHTHKESQITVCYLLSVSIFSSHVSRAVSHRDGDAAHVRAPPPALRLHGLRCNPRVGVQCT